MSYSASCAPQAKLTPEATLATVLWTLALSTVLLGLALILTGKLQVRTGPHYTTAVLRKTRSLYKVHKNTSGCVESRPGIIMNVVYGRVCSHDMYAAGYAAGCVCFPARGPLLPASPPLS